MVFLDMVLPASSWLQSPPDVSLGVAAAAAAAFSPSGLSSTGPSAPCRVPAARTDHTRRTGPQFHRQAAGARGSAGTAALRAAEGGNQGDRNSSGPGRARVRGPASRAQLPGGPRAAALRARALPPPTRVLPACSSWFLLPAVGSPFSAALYGAGFFTCPPLSRPVVPKASALGRTAR